MPSPATRAEMLKGARFGQHVVVRLVGHGATATVFEGRHETLGKRVALKVLHEHLAANAELAGRFVREGQVAAQLHHPSIIDVRDVGVENGLPYLVMELLEGRDLRAELDARVKLTLPAALSIILPLTSALAHAHDKGALHRDLKPANVFLGTDHRGDVVPKLVDFGLSKLVGAFADNNPLTDTETVVGTLLYMAPEQTYGSKLSSTKSDQYSLAAILYEAVCGRPPIVGEGFYALLENIRNAPIEPPTLVDPRLPEELDAILLRALHRDPEKRWPSARALGHALLPFADETTRAEWGRDFGSEKLRVENERAGPSAARVLATGVVEAAPKPREGEPAEASTVRRIDPLPCAPGKSPFHIKGIAYRGVLQFAVREVPGGLEGLCSALDDPRLAAFVRQPFLATGWYDVLPVLPIAAAAARLVHRPLDQFVRMCAMAQCRYDAKTVFKRLFETSRIETLQDGLPRFSARYYDFGRIDAWLEKPGHLVSRQTLIPAYLEPWFAPMHAGYAEEVARVLGATHAEGTERRSVPGPAHEGYPTVTLETDVRYRS